MAASHRRGRKAPARQEDLRLAGHAIEARVYAEDPRRDFPSGFGPRRASRAAAESENVRVDTGVRSGDEITVHYDPMIAKLIVRTTIAARRSSECARRSGNSRSRARRPISILWRLVQDRDFVRADFDTGLIERNRSELLAPPAAAGEDALTLAVLSQLDAGLGGEARRPGERFFALEPGRWLARDQDGVRPLRLPGGRNPACGDRAPPGRGFRARIRR